MGQTIKLTASDGVSIDAYRAEPAGTPKGGIVVLQEIFGVNPHIRRVADGYAAAGYLAIAPALFDRAEPGVELGYAPDDIPRGVALVGEVGHERTMLDVAAAVKAAAEGGEVGVVGYCWGGSLAYRGGLRRSTASRRRWAITAATSPSRSTRSPRCR